MAESYVTKSYLTTQFQNYSEVIKDKFTFAIYEDQEGTKLIKEVKSDKEEELLMALLDAGIEPVTFENEDGFINVEVKYIDNIKTREVIESIEASTPSRNSSITIVFPPTVTMPNARPWMMRSRMKKLNNPATMYPAKMAVNTV